MANALKKSAPAATAQSATLIAPDPLWYKDSVIYQLHVRAFYDSNGDGIGDFKGLVGKLDYLQDLGVNVVWLLPFYPSPLKDDGYDIADYEQINESYGSLKDFREFLREAHTRGIRVITELVINHTSDQHVWFQKSRRAQPGSYWHDFYVWNETPDLYKEVRIIFKDFETSNWSWDPVKKQYYWHRFFHHQPDLNFDNPNVQKQIFKLIDKWMSMGVDGLRLDAVPYLFERDGTSCENLPETHEFLKKLRAYLDSKFQGRMLLAEANQWPEDAAEYFGDGDECHMNFHFPLMPRLFMALKMEDRYSLVDIMNQTPDIPESCQWATFLRNHDELTLEMVTDEERDFMYRAYASDQRARINLGIRRRLAPLLGNDRRQIQLLNGLLFSFPGTPIIYYGDEIGMGDNIFLGDRNGCRTPFQWSPDRNAGFSQANPQSLYLPVNIAPEYHYETVNVETQQKNPNSLLWWMKNLIEMRKRHVALTRGSLRFLNPDNPKVLALVREYKDPDTGEEHNILIVANLSKTSQYVEVDLKEFKGLVPVELMGHTAFPPVGELPYFITLGPYDFYWFSLTHQQSMESSQWLLRDKRSSMAVSENPLEAIKKPRTKAQLEDQIAMYLPGARWFTGKGKVIDRVKIRDVVVLDHYGVTKQSALLIVDVNYTESALETYLITLTYAEAERAEFIRSERPDLVIGEYQTSGKEKGIYHEAILDAAFGQALLDHILKRKRKKGGLGEAEGKTFTTIKREWTREIPEPSFTSHEQSNSSLRFGHNHFMKIFRKLDEGLNPEVEIGQHFVERSPFKNTSKLVGSLRYTTSENVYSLVVVHQFVEAQKSAWDLFLDQVSQMAELVSTHGEDEVTPPQSGLSFFDGVPEQVPVWFKLQMSYPESLILLLGRRTAEMHLALAKSKGNKDFKPEELTPFYQRAFYQSLRNRASGVKSHLQKTKAHLSEKNKKTASQLLKEWGAIQAHFEMVRKENLGGELIRIHGDYHLGQVLFDGKDFIIIDYEGEPLRTVSERRLKRSPLQDVAGVLRSIDYCVYYYLKERVFRNADREKMSPWLKMWGHWMSARFIEGYMEVCGGSDLMPDTPEKVRFLTEVFLIEKALYEVEYELGSRPDWVDIPLKGILNLLPALSSRCEDE